MSEYAQKCEYLTIILVNLICPVKDLWLILFVNSKELTHIFYLFSFLLFLFPLIYPSPSSVSPLLAQLPKQPLQKTAAHSQALGVVVGGGAHEQEIFVSGGPIPAKLSHMAERA